MKKLSTILVLASAFVSASALNAAPCRSGSIEQLVNQLSDAYAEKKLGNLDKEKPYLETIQFVVEHAIADSYEVEETTSLENIEKWLGSHEREGFPAREARPLLWCKNGLCVFNFSNGIAHNHRYIEKVTYGYTKGCPYIKTVFLLNGD